MMIPRHVPSALLSSVLCHKYRGSVPPPERQRLDAASEDPCPTESSRSRPGPSERLPAGLATGHRHAHFNTVREHDMKSTSCSDQPCRYGMRNSSPVEVFCFTSSLISHVMCHVLSSMFRPASRHCPEQSQACSGWTYPSCRLIGSAGLSCQSRSLLHPLQQSSDSRIRRGIPLFPALPCGRSGINRAGDRIVRSVFPDKSYGFLGFISFW